MARAAGVSAATVSYVLNNGPRAVSADKKERVLAASQQLGYQPNAIARSLRSRHSSLIGLVLPDNANPYYADLARCLEDAAFARGLHILVGNSADDPERERAHLNVLYELRVEGVIVIPADVDEHYRRSPIGDSIPMVMVDRQIPDLPVDTVTPDNALGGALATQHLIDLGHRNLACISGPASLLHAAARLRGAQDVLLRAGLPDMRIGEGRFTYEDGYRVASELCTSAPCITGLICANDAMAIGALSAAARMERKVPEQLSIVGFDDVPQAAYTAPSLTTLAQPRKAMAELALELLVQRMHGSERPPEHHTIPPTLIVRDSTSAPPKR